MKRVQLIKWDVTVGQYAPYGFSYNTGYVELNYRQICTTEFRVVEKCAINYTNLVMLLKEVLTGIRVLIK